MDLADCRKEVDLIDAKLLLLLEERAVAIKQIGVLKTRAGLPIVDSEREEAILQGITRELDDKLPIDSAVRIFRAIIRESRLIQKAEYLPDLEKIGR